MQQYSHECRRIVTTYLEALIEVDAELVEADRSVEAADAVLQQRVQSRQQVVDALRCLGGEEALLRQANDFRGK